MKASELISVLAQNIAQYGDNSVWIRINGEFKPADQINYMIDTQGMKYFEMASSEVRDDTNKGDIQMREKKRDAKELPRRRADIQALWPDKKA